MAITTKKIRLIPLGDKEEVTRVYDYLRDGMYNQHHMLNIYMSEVASLFYSCNMDTDSDLYKKGYEKIFSETNDVYKKLESKLIGPYVTSMDKHVKDTKKEINDIKKEIKDADKYVKDMEKHVKDLKKELKEADKGISSPEYKEKYNMIFRNTNKNIEFIKQAKGLGMTGTCGMRVRSDFSTALKSGLARGEKRLPFYKKDFPLLVPGRFINFYYDKEKYINDKGEEKERDIIVFKFVNHIYFKVIVGTYGKNNTFIISLLDSIINDSEHYNVRGSSIQFDKRNKNKIILNLTVDIKKKKEEQYIPEPNKVMGLSMGFNKCITAALKDTDEIYEIGNAATKEEIINNRIYIQRRRREMQINLKNARGGHGRKRKVDNTFIRQRAYEKNCMKNFNHILSKEVIDFAKKNKVSTIIIEDIEKEDLRDYPVLLRNWSYFQLEEFIKYKAAAEGIEFKKASKKTSSIKKDENGLHINTGCCKCGSEIEINTQDSDMADFEWCKNITFICPECNEQIDYSYNKAKLISYAV